MIDKEAVREAVRKTITQETGVIMLDEDIADLFRGDA